MAGPNWRRSSRLAERQQQQQQQARPRRTSPHSAQGNPADGDIDPGNLSPQSRRRYQSRMSSARLRERQRLQIATAEEDVARLEAHVRELQSSIDYHYQTHMGMHGGPPQLTEGSGAARDSPPPLLCEEDIAEIRATVTGLMQSENSTVSSSFHMTTPEQQRPRSIDEQIHGSIASMSVTINHLERCMHRIDALKDLIALRVSNLEHGTGQALPSQLSLSVSSGETLRNPVASSGSGSGRGSAAEFVSEQQSKRRRSTEQPPTSRFAISFLLDKSSDA